MRRIAAELGAGTMTLYYYVRTKDELVALMDDALMGEVLIPEDEFPTHWYEAMTAIAQRTWDVLMRHPWALASLQSAAVGPNGMLHFEQSLAALAGTGLGAPDRFALIAWVDDYVHGNVLRAAEMNSPNDVPPEEAVRFGQSQLATGRFPHTMALFGDEDPRTAFPKLLGGRTDRERFRDGLAMLLRGAAAELALSLP
jgi:AcrR family transcriptional regulator